ncbi:MAG: DUF1343 domain-containing protein [Bdellovibrio sp.]|nr:MAG: DUF1343 domain-containing protein [Bdellovibrio sp.]
MIELGIDRLLREESLRRQFSGQRLALLGNQASMTSDFRHSMDALFQQGLRLSAAFGPQHGIRGEKQDNMQETPDDRDKAYEIPVFSLYSKTRRPTPEMMKTFDVLLVDLQDVGTRIYTFLTTLLYVLEACAAHKKKIVVLDRPNPAGRPVEGLRLEKGWTSFVGSAEGLPMRHGLTLGEAARWFCDRLKIAADLTVVEMKNYRIDQAPGHGWPSELPWVNPSPNASTLSMARAFPGTVLIEGTLLSEGRGTTRPLETIGGPNLDMERILVKMAELSPRWLQGCRLRKCFFMPTFHKHSGHIIPGLQIHVDEPFYDPHIFKPYRLVTLWLKSIRILYPHYPVYRDFQYEYETERLAFDLINGGPGLREWIEDPQATCQALDERLRAAEEGWIEERKQYLLY